MLILHRKGFDKNKKKYVFNPLDKGWLKFLLLRLVYEEPKHGYQIANELVERGYINPERLSVGSMYIILNRMEKYGILTSTREISDEGRDRRVYSITEFGKEILKKGLESVLQRKAAMDDLEMFCSFWLSEPFVPEYFEEDFETGDFSRHDWQHTGDAPWSVVSDEAIEGVYSAKSGLITHSQQSTLQIQTNFDGTQIAVCKQYFLVCLKPCKPLFYG